MKQQSAGILSETSNLGTQNAQIQAPLSILSPLKGKNKVRSKIQRQRLSKRLRNLDGATEFFPSTTPHHYSTNIYLQKFLLFHTAWQGVKEK